MISDDPRVVALGEARSRAQQAVAGGRVGGLLDPQTLVADYRAALADCSLDDQALRAIQHELIGRLMRGIGLTPDDSAIGRHFETLLSRYEAVEDVLCPEDARRRLAKWELRIVDAMLATQAREGSGHHA